MARHDPTLALIHMIDAIERLEELLAEFPTAAALEANWRDRAAAERMVEILSEASRRLPADWIGSFPDIPWRQIADFGNVLRHGYDTIKLDLIVKLGAGDAASLKAVVETLLDRAEPDWRRERERRRRAALDSNDA